MNRRVRNRTHGGVGGGSRKAPRLPDGVPGRPLQNASSIAGLLLTTEALITEIPEDNDKEGAAAGAGMDY